jgi:hypothetical protein
MVNLGSVVYLGRVSPSKETPIACSHIEKPEALPAFHAISCSGFPAFRSEAKFAIAPSGYRLYRQVKSLSKSVVVTSVWAFIKSVWQHCFRALDCRDKRLRFNPPTIFH